MEPPVSGWFSMRMRRCASLIRCAEALSLHGVWLIVKSGCFQSTHIIAHQPPAPSIPTTSTNPLREQNAPDAEDERRLPARHLVLEAALVEALGEQCAHPAPAPAAGRAPASGRLRLLLGLVLVVRLV